MCGFLGIISNTSQINFKQSYLKGLIGHRGPDMNGFFLSFDEKAMIFFSRLAINDLSVNGNQPFEYGNFLLVANCEIYNFQELRSQLIHKYKFKSHSDAEVLLFSFIEWGEDFVKKIDGMFAIAIFDKIEKKLLIYRDRLGIKPLYYFYNNDYFIFSSEFIPVLELTKSLKIFIGINEDSIENYLLGPFNFLNSTHIKGIFKVKPGHYIVLDKNLKKEKKFWDYSNVKKKKLSLEESIFFFKKIFEENLKKHLISDVPISVMLSGGVDSSYISMVASKFSNKNYIDTTTIDIDETLTNFEKNNIKELTDKIKLKNTILQVSSKNIIKDIFNNIAVYDDLQSSDPGFLTNYEIAKTLKKNNIKVVLVGDGADEVLGGYSWFGLSKLPFSILPESIKNYFYIYSTSRIFSKKNSLKVYQKYLLEMKKFKNADYFDNICQNEMSNQLPNNYLMKVDKPFMRCGIEARVPFLDNNFIEYAISMKSEFKLKGMFYFLSSFKKANEKFILREVFKKALDTKVSSAKKKGFSISMHKIINDNKNFFKNVLLDRSSYLPNSSIVETEKLINNIESSVYHPIKKENEIYIWKLFLLNIWKSKYLNGVI